MKVLFDLSQIVISSAIEYFSSTREEVSIDLVRHICLQQIQYYIHKFNTPIKDVIICCDGRHYWRKVIFPEYKQNRRISQKADKFDWDRFFEFFNIIKDELKNELPFRIIEVDACEADDVIAVLCQLLCSYEDRLIIISSDKDLIQIQDMCSKVTQWSPINKKFINSSNKEYELFDHVVRGDSGDGIPNIMSDDDVHLIKGKRSASIRSKTIEQWKECGGFESPEKFCSEHIMLKRFERNRKLIDLRLIPEEIVETIRNTLENHTQSNLKISSFDYLVKHKLTKLMERGGF